jgi:3-mercaptopyruvate sulfurtransferase SseA
MEDWGMRLAPVFLLALIPAVHANPAIDMEGYLRVSREAAEHRQSRRVSEQEFIRMSREPGTVVLDARSRQKFDELHVKGAISLPFPDIAIEPQTTIPDKATPS